MTQRDEFELWVKSRQQSVERYPVYPFSYKLSEVSAMWDAWDAACTNEKRYNPKLMVHPAVAERLTPGELDNCEVHSEIFRPASWIKKV